MKKRQKPLLLHSTKKQVMAFLLFGIAGLAFAAKPSVNVYKLTYEGVSPKTADSINDAIYSFIAEVKDYTIRDFRNQPTPADTSLIKSNFIFYGNIAGDSDGVKINLVLKNVSDDTTRLISKHYASSNIILIESRALVNDLFSSYSIQGEPSDSSQAKSKKQAPTDILGRWNGESGISSITLLPNNRAIIALKSGVSISAVTDLKGNKLTVTQKSSVSAKQFSDLPAVIAQEAIKKAKPLKWVFRVSDDMMKLTGTKLATEIAHNGKAITAVRFVEVPVVWTRQ
ncbi:MAG: hypothetical protein CR988_02035 [Treponema sp.]|nr:MAG: hypothetical protein CR988_02035 [Treponema sp.]